jgi:hypothetical protein
MASRYGGKIVTDGLVLCLDAHDAKSYAGEPITNMAYNLSVAGHGSTWEAITNVPGSEGQTGPGANINFKKLHDDSVANTFSGSNGKIFRNYVNNPATSNTTSFNNNGGFRYSSSINLTSGGASGYVIISFWCYLVTGYQGYVTNGLGSAYMQFSDSGGTYTGNGSKSFYVDGVSKTTNETFNGDTGRWKFVQIRFTKPANSTAIRNFYIYADRNTQGEMYICQLQIEDRSDSTFYQVPFVEGASSRSANDGWKDRTANSNDGTLTNMAGTGADHYRAGQVIMPVSNSYLEFDGSNDKADCGSVTPDTGDFTVEFIYQLTGNGGRGGLFERKAGSPYNGFSLGQGGSGNWGFVVSGTSNFSAGSYLNLTWTYPTLNTWYHDVGVYSGGNSISIYRNGSLVSSTSGTSQGNLSTQGTRTNFLIANRDNSTSLPCKVGLVRVYNTALSAAEILQNYNTTKGRYL